MPACPACPRARLPGPLNDIRHLRRLSRKISPSPGREGNIPCCRTLAFHTAGDPRPHRHSGQARRHSEARRGGGGPDSLPVPGSACLDRHRFRRGPTTGGVCAGARAWVCVCARVRDGVPRTERTPWVGRRRCARRPAARARSRPPRPPVRAGPVGRGERPRDPDSESRCARRGGPRLPPPPAPPPRTRRAGPDPLRSRRCHPTLGVLPCVGSRRTRLRISRGEWVGGGGAGRSVRPRPRRRRRRHRRRGAGRRPTRTSARNPGLPF